MEFRIGASFDGDIFTTLRDAGAAIADVKKGVNVDDFEKLKEGIEVVFSFRIGQETQAESNEITELFSGVAHENEEELLQELDDLESENVESQLEGINVSEEKLVSPAGNIKAKVKAEATTAAVKSQPKKNEADKKALEDIMS